MTKGFQITLLFSMFLSTVLWGQQRKFSHKDLVQKLQSQDSNQQFQALQTIQQMGVKAQTLLPLLTKALSKNKKSWAILYAVSLINPKQLETFTVTKIHMRGGRKLGRPKWLENQTKLRYDKKYALVIGINKYTHSDVANLHGANFDAAEVAATLATRFGFDVTLLIDQNPPFKMPEGVTVNKVSVITQKICQKIVSSLSRKIGQNDALLFYYAGHGIRDYMVAGNSDFKDKKSMISWAQLAQSLKECSAHHTLMILDCCFSGAIFQNNRVSKAVGVLQKRTLRRGIYDNLSRVFSRRSFQIITAGSGDEEVSDQISASAKYALKNKDQQGHSPFTAVFLQAIQGLTGMADGRILASDLGYYVNNTLVTEKSLKAFQAPRYKSLGEGEGDFVFFPIGRVLNPKLVAPLYLSEENYADLRRAACYGLQQFIKRQPQKQQKNLVRSALSHLTLILHDKNSSSQLAALKVLANWCKKYSDLEEFTTLVPSFINIFAQKSQRTNAKARQYAAVCLTYLHAYATFSSVATIERYLDYLDQKWRKFPKSHLPKKVQKQQDTLKELAKSYFYIKSQGNVQASHLMKLLQKRYEIYQWLEQQGQKIIAKQQQKLRELKLQLLQGQNRFDRIAAIEKLVGVGEEAYPSLISALGDSKNEEDDDITDALKKAFIEIAKKTSYKPLLTMLANSDYTIRKNAIKALEYIARKQKSSQIISAFEKALNDVESEVRDQALLTLAKVDRTNAHLLKNVEIHLHAIFSKESTWFDSLVLEEVIGKMKINAAPVVPTIAAFIKETLEDLQYAETPEEKIQYREKITTALELLENIGIPAQKAIPVLKTIFFRETPIKSLQKATAKTLVRIGGAFPILLKALENKDSKQEVAAAFAYLAERYVRISPQEITILMKEMIKKDPFVIQTVLFLLKDVENMPKSILPVLEKLLAYPQRNIRRMAVSALARMGAWGYPLLLKASSDKDPKIRIAVLRKFAYRACELPQLAIALKDKELKVRIAAIKVIGQKGNNADSLVANLLARFKHSNNSWEKITIIKTLGKIGGNAIKAVPMLEKSLDKFGLDAAIALTLIYPKSKKTLPLLLRALERRKNTVEVIEALGTMEENAHKALPLLLKLLKDKKLRNYAAMALPKIAKTNPQRVVQKLAEVLKSAKTSNVPIYRSQTNLWKSVLLKSLGRFGSSAQLTIPMLLPMLESKIQYKRVQAAIAIAQISPQMVSKHPQIMTILIRSIQDIDSIETNEIIPIFKALGNKAKPVIPQLFELLGTARMAYGEILAALGEKTIPGLIKNLKSRKKRRVAAASLALSKMGPKIIPEIIKSARSALHVVPILLLPVPKHVIVAQVQKFLASNNDYERQAAIMTLTALKVNIAPLLSKILPLLNDPVPDVRRKAAEILMQVNKKHYFKVIPMLKRLLKDKDTIVRLQTAYTLDALKVPFDIKPFLSILVSSSFDEASAAMKVFGKIKSKEAIPYLLRIIGGDSGLKISATRCLQKIGVNNVAIKFALKQMINSSKEEDERAVAKIALAMLNSNRLQRQKVLKKYLNHKDFFLRLSALDAFGDLENIELLLEKFGDNKMGKYAAEFLTKAGVKAIDPLFEFSKYQKSSLYSNLFRLDRHGSFWYRLRRKIRESHLLEEFAELSGTSALKLATKAIANMGKPAIAKVLQAIAHPNPKVRRQAAEILGIIKINQPQIVVALNKALYDSHYHVRRAAAVALGQIGATNTAQELEVAVVKEHNIKVKIAIIQALMNLQFTDKAISLWQQLLFHSNYMVRGHAALQLGKIGKKAISTLGDLNKLLQDRHFIVRAYAQKAIAIIGKEGKKTIVPVFQKNPLKQCLFYFDRGDFAKALAHVEVLCKNSEDPRYWVFKAWLLNSIWKNRKQNVKQAQKIIAKYFPRLYNAQTPFALFLIGSVYHGGVGVDADLTLALRWYEKAAVKGSPRAIAAMGQMYTSGQLGTMSAQKVLQWLYKAESTGNLWVLCGLAFVLEKRGDFTRALQYYRKAEAQGSLIAMWNLGRLHQAGPNPNVYEAIFWYKKAISRGYSNAYSSLGNLYAMLNNVKVALEVLQKGVQEGNPLAMISLGNLYARMGNFSKAKQAFKQAVAIDYLPAFMQMGFLCQSQGKYKEAKIWYERSIDKNIPQAYAAIGNLYFSGLGVPANRLRAVTWYKKGANKGDMQAIFSLAKIYHYGYLGIVDLKEALKWYRKAAMSGDIAVRQVVQRLEQQLGK